MLFDVELEVNSTFLSVNSFHFCSSDHARLFNNPLYNMRQRMGLNDNQVNLDQSLLVDFDANPSNCAQF